MSEQAVGDARAEFHARVVKPLTAAAAALEGTGREQDRLAAARIRGEADKARSRFERAVRAAGA